MHPFPLAGAVGLAIFLVVRLRQLGRASARRSASLVVAGLALWGLGIVEPPNLTKLIEDVGRAARASGPTCSSAALAFLETGAFVGLIAPGESAVLIGGVVAGQGEISIVRADRARVGLRGRRRPDLATRSAAGSGAASSSATGRG